MRMRQGELWTGQLHCFHNSNHKMCSIHNGNAVIFLNVFVFKLKSPKSSWCHLPMRKIQYTNKFSEFLTAKCLTFLFDYFKLSSVLSVKFWQNCCFDLPKRIKHFLPKSHTSKQGFTCTLCSKVEDFILLRHLCIK